MKELKKDENILLGKLIGLLNGIDEFMPTKSLIEDIKSILSSLKRDRDLDIMIRLVDKLKKQYLPNCSTCSSPCGRTNDFFLNDIENEILKEDRINEYHRFISSYTSIMDFSEIVYNISKLSW